MRKLSLAAALLALCAVSLVAQEVPGASASTLLGVSSYSRLFINSNGLLGGKYDRAASDEDYMRVAALSGHSEMVDTELEISILSTCAGVVNIRPVEADKILPANNPRESGLKLGAAVYKELTEIKFLDPQNTASIGRYEGMLRFISERNGVSRTEIENYFRQGIRGLVSEIVEAEFNKISFSMSNDAIRKGYNTVLTRTPNNQYVLSYEGVYQGKPFSEKLTATSLEALLAEMRGNTADFDQGCIDAVRTQAALIPAVVYAEWQKIGVAQGTDAVALVTETLTNFYLNPSRSTYEAVRGIYARCSVLSISNDIFAEAASHSFNLSLEALNPGIARKVEHDRATGNLANMARIPDDPRFNVFSTRYGIVP
jgi:hypothetical protein